MIQRCSSGIPWLPFVLAACSSNSPAPPAASADDRVQTHVEVIHPRVSATTIHGWNTSRLVKLDTSLYASAAKSNPEAKHFWDHEGVFFRREADGTWSEAGTLPLNPYTMCVASDGTFWVVAPSSYSECRILRSKRVGELDSLEVVRVGGCSYLGAGVSPEGNFLVLYAASPDSTAGVANAVVADFYDRSTGDWHTSTIATPEGRYGYEGILLRGRRALVVLQSSLTDPLHSDVRGTNYSWRHVRIAACDDLLGGTWKNEGWLVPQDGRTFLHDLVEGPDGNAYLSYCHASAASHEALLDLAETPHCIARIHDDLTVEVFETGLDVASTRILVDAGGAWHLIGRSGAGGLRLWDLDPDRGFKPTRECELEGTEWLADYVIHTLRPDRFGGDGDGDTVHLLGTPSPPDPPGKERADVELVHVWFRFERDGR